MYRSIACAALLLGPVAAEAQKPRPNEAGRNGWYSDYQLARAEARRTGKPMLVVFRCEP